MDRLAQLVSFEQVTAPFDGVITNRQIDVGSLVTADAASGTPLFSIARTDVLRVQIYVPQSDHFGIRDGDRATITIPELPIVSSPALWRATPERYPVAPARCSPKSMSTTRTRY